MDMEEIRYLLGGTIFARAKAYTDRIQDLNCEPMSVLLIFGSISRLLSSADLKTPN